MYSKEVEEEGRRGFGESRFYDYFGKSSVKDKSISEYSKSKDWWGNKGSEWKELPFIGP